MPCVGATYTAKAYWVFINFKIVVLKPDALYLFFIFCERGLVDVGIKIKFRTGEYSALVMVIDRIRVKSER